MGGAVRAAQVMSVGVTTNSTYAYTTEKLIDQKSR
jgi:hypothetical protein